MNEIIKREFRVAFSKRAQPVWFRILKWLVFLSVSAVLWNTPYFVWWLLGAFALSMSVHFIWRHKTRGWTRPWGSWNDVEAAK
jgi:hypothetical protein